MAGLMGLSPPASGVMVSSIPAISWWRLLGGVDDELSVPGPAGAERERAASILAVTVRKAPVKVTGVAPGTVKRAGAIGACRRAGVIIAVGATPVLRSRY